MDARQVILLCLVCCLWIVVSFFLFLSLSLGLCLRLLVGSIDVVWVQWGGRRRFVISLSAMLCTLIHLHLMLKLQR